MAGGENTRFPLTKGFLRVNGNRIIDSNVALLAKIFDRVIISTNTPEKYFYLGIPLIGDVVVSKGPMTGIFSALAIPGVPSIFVTACD
ncbi:MAG: NTP transferase domain-containing protein, partial [Nitrospirota bacterium]